MKTYIALLRGINVGGNNKVAMPLLKESFITAGFAQVRTYINSGNVIFDAPEQDAEALQQRCREAIFGQFGLQIPVAVLSAGEYAEALAQAPAWWARDPAAKHNGIFVIAPLTGAQLIEQVGPHRPEYEQVAAHGRVVFWSAPLKTFSRTRWSKVIATPAYAQITIRNANTTKKLLQLTQEAAL